MSEIQHPPFSVQIELVEGCTLSCSFCGINGIRKKPGGFKYMELSTIARVASEIQRLGWTPRIEFAMHGEPSVYPKLVSAVKIVRKRLPKVSIMMTSNGTGFLKDAAVVRRMASVGLNVLGLDNYEHAPTIIPRVLEQFKKISFKPPIRYYPQDKSSSIYNKRKPDTFEVVILQDVSTTTSGNHVLANHAGQAFEPDYSKRNARCAFPFRDLAVRWDGNVSLCCDDFRGTYRIANVNEIPLDELWQHERYRAARRKLY